MAFFNADCAVSSLGVSCQTAMQLEVHEAALSFWLGGGKIHKTPLDWLLAPVPAVVRMLDDWRFVPPIEEAKRDPWLRWPHINAVYPHEHRWRDAPEEIVAKYAHKADWLARVAEKRRKVFIVSNTQNNLREPDWTDRLGDAWWWMDDAGLSKLRASLERRFGAVELYAVTYADRHGIEDGADALFELTPDKSNVGGDNGQWLSVLEKIVSRQMAAVSPK